MSSTEGVDWPATGHWHDDGGAHPHDLGSCCEHRRLDHQDGTGDCHDGSCDCRSFLNPRGPLYVCDVAGCKQGFRTMDEVIEHERTHRHGGDGERA